MKRIDDACAALLPGVLAEYLWQFIDETADDDCRIELSARKLGAGMVQDIIVRNGTAAVRRTVFGFEPVNAQLRVLKAGDGLSMCVFTPQPPGQSLH